MSFNDDIVLTTTANPTGNTYSKTSESNNQVIRRDPSSDIGEPADLRIATERSSTRQQTAVILEKQLMAADEVTLRKLKITVKVDFPVDGTFTSLQIAEEKEAVLGFISDPANFTKLLNGEK